MMMKMDYGEGGGGVMVARWWMTDHIMVREEVRYMLVVVMMMMMMMVMVAVTGTVLEWQVVKTVQCSVSQWTVSHTHYYVGCTLLCRAVTSSAMTSRQYERQAGRDNLVYGRVHCDSDGTVTQVHCDSDGAVTQCTVTVTVQWHSALWQWRCSDTVQRDGSSGDRDSIRVTGWDRSTLGKHCTASSSSASHSQRARELLKVESKGLWCFLY